MTDQLKVVTLCTGNVARSVMLGYMLNTLAHREGLNWQLRSAGTHATEGSAVSARTRDALVAIKELGEQRYGLHRSHQLRLDDVDWADAILAVEADHVHYVRRTFSTGAAKTVQLAQFVARAPAHVSRSEQVAYAASLEPEARLDVADPAGCDQAGYDACARQLWSLAGAFAALRAGGESA